MKAAPQPQLQLPAGINRTAPVVVAVSGGADSTALLVLLKEAGFEKIIVAHLEHGLRGEASLADAEAVIALAGNLGCDVAMDRLNPPEPGLSVSENELRNARRKFLRETAERTGASVIFLGHHADDQIETVLMNLFRGSGTRGLIGIRPSREEAGLLWVRPLLQSRKVDLIEFLKSRNLSYCEDATNFTLEATRNRVRNELLPRLETLFGRDVGASILRLSKQAASEHQWMESIADETAIGERLKTRDLQVLPEALQRRILHRWLLAMGVPDCGFELVENARGLLVAVQERPAKINLPGGRFLRRTQGEIYITGEN